MVSRRGRVYASRNRGRGRRCLHTLFGRLKGGRVCKVTAIAVTALVVLMCGGLRFGPSGNR